MHPLPSAIQEIYPFKSNWMEIRERRLHYLDEGQDNGKPPVVLLHGNPTWSFLYREIIPKITDHCRVIAPDYLGFGLSDKPAEESFYTLENHTNVIAEFINRLDLRNVYLVLQDWGGPIGFGYALANMKNVAGMVIMNTWAWPEPSLFHASILPWKMLHAPIVGSHFFLRCNALVERGLYLSTGRREKYKSGAVLDGYRLPFPTPESRIGMLAFPRNIPLKPGDLNWTRLARMRRDIRNFPFPCRIIWGEKDQVFPPTNAHLLHKLIPNCSHPRMIREGMHFIQEDAPDEIAEEILMLTGAMSAGV